MLLPSCFPVVTKPTLPRPHHAIRVQDLESAAREVQGDMAEATQATIAQYLRELMQAQAADDEARQEVRRAHFATAAAGRAFPVFGGLAATPFRAHSADSSSLCCPLLGAGG